MPASQHREPLFIFEMANNHSGSLQHGLRIVEEMGRIARRHRITAAVKLQYRDLSTFIHPAHRGSDAKHIRRFLSTELPFADYQTMVAAIHEQGMLAACTPFDESSLDILVNHGIDIVKIASCSANDWPLLERIAATSKPVICSTGGLRQQEMDQIVNFFEHRRVHDFSLLHCVGLYPTPNDALQMHVVDWMRRRYHWLRIGYSGHEAPDNLDPVKIAVAKGARILERHVGVPTPQSPLNAYSMDPEQTDRWVQAALLAREICGDATAPKHVPQEELDSLLSLKRGTYLRRPVKAGEPVAPEDVFFAMPCSAGQTSSSEYLAGMAASRDYAADEALHERRPRSVAVALRGLLHEAKGMLHEAGIRIGGSYSIDMSHHYGPDRFRQQGAIIVNLINREYCKKLIIVLPGQSHPSHRHLVKEESFQLLYGDLEIVRNGERTALRPGDIALVERGMWHSFSSRHGAIFEEVSTTHVVGDSYYEDPAIASVDPMQRKTVLESW
ncbi:MAG: N-acetylneuraminate synthase family protein [Phycisphaerales bacterium]